MNSHKKSSLSELAYKEIKNMIVTLELLPGTQVDEAKLMEKLSIGRTPVREALFRLVTINLLLSEPGRGFMVRPIGLDDIKHLFEAAMVIWRAADVFATEFISENILESLCSINSALRDAAIEADIRSLNLLNSKFHCIVHDSIKNDFIRHSVQLLEPQYSRLSYLNLSSSKVNLHDYYQLIAQDHDDLIDAFKEKDGNKVFQISTVHLRRFNSKITKYISPNEDSLIDMAFVRDEFG